MSEKFQLVSGISVRLADNHVNNKINEFEVILLMYCRALLQLVILFFSFHTKGEISCGSGELSSTDAQCTVGVF